jgi:hypothetical protein
MGRMGLLPRIRVVVIFILLAGHAACITPLFRRIAADVEPMPPGVTVAVVCGQRTAHCASLAGLVTQKLKASGKVDVLSQDDVAARLEVYPSNLSSHAFLDEKEASAKSLLPAHLSTCARLHSRLGVDYIFLVWFHAYESYTVTTVMYQNKAPIYNSKTIYYFDVRSRLIRYPDEKVVGAVNYCFEKTYLPPLLATQKETGFLTMVNNEAAAVLVEKLLPSGMK